MARRKASAPKPLPSGSEWDFASITAYDEALGMEGEFAEPLIEKKALNAAASLNLREGSPAKAEPLLNTLIAKFPEYSPGFLTLGSSHYNAGRLADAEKAYRKALELNPSSIEALFCLGNICLETGRVGEARAFYQNAYDNGGNSPDLQYNLACVEALARDYPKSLQHLDEALRLGYRNLEALTRNAELAGLRQLPSFSQLLAGYFPGSK